MTMVIVSMVLMGCYLALMAALYGITDTVSSTYYISKHKWIFTVVMVLTAILLLPVMLDKGGDFQFLAFFAAFGLALVGVEPHYRMPYGRCIHVGGMLTALIAGTGWCLSMTAWPTIIIASLYVLYLAFVKKYKYYAGEILALLNIYVTLMVV